MPVVLALLVLFLLILPVGALVEEESGVGLLLSSANGGHAAPAAIIGGSDISISNLGSGSPAIDISNDGTFVAVAYYKIGRNEGGVHVKSATAAQGWLTTRYLGPGQNPSLAFSSNANDRVFVVWVKDENKAIGFADCTLALSSPPSCTISNLVTVASGNLDTPDIVVDSTDPQVLHAAWVQDGDIRTARSANSGVSWQLFNNIPTSGAANDFETPQLAASNNLLHLAFRNKSSVDNLGKSIRYYRAANSAIHSWANLKNFRLGIEVNGQYNDLANPAIVASGSNVYLAWDAQTDAAAGDDDDFGLMRVESKTDGFSWATASHITQNTNAATNVQNPLKISRKSGAGVVPVQEGALRPSMTISGSGFALVWQQRGIDGQGCQEDGNASSEIHHAYTDTVWSEDVLADDETQYSIDPDLAVDSGGISHFAFMKDPDADNQDPGCIGGEANEYGIYYRGPFTLTLNDKGEDPADPDTQPTIYLPIIMKS